MYLDNFSHSDTFLITLMSGGITFVLVRALVILFIPMTQPTTS